MRDGDVGVALSVLYQPFDEIDLTQSYGAPPRESYFKAIVDQRQTVEDYVAAHSGAGRDRALGERARRAARRRGPDPDPRDRGRLPARARSGGGAAQRARSWPDLGIAYVTVAHLFFRDVATNAPALPFLPDWLYNLVFPQAKDEGLTALGHEVVDAMVDEGILIDITHMRSQSIRDVFAQLDARDPAKEIPVIATHMAYRFGGLQYSFDDETIKAVAARGGVLGCILCEHYMTSGLSGVSSLEGSLEALCKHIDKIHELTGSYDHIAIGSDLDGYIKPALPGLEDMSRMTKLAGPPARSIRRRGCRQDLQRQRAPGAARGVGPQAAAHLAAASGRGSLRAAAC